MAHHCVKDLDLGAIHFERRDGRTDVTLELAPNLFAHSEGLVIVYTDVTAFTMTTAGKPGGETKRLGPLQLDEILPCSGGWRGGHRDCRGPAAQVDG